jgi:hypothetical protein
VSTRNREFVEQQYDSLNDDGFQRMAEAADNALDVFEAAVRDSADG